MPPALVIDWTKASESYPLSPSAYSKEKYGSPKRRLPEIGIKDHFFALKYLNRPDHRRGEGKAPSTC